MINPNFDPREDYTWGDPFEDASRVANYVFVLAFIAVGVGALVGGIELLSNPNPAGSQIGQAIWGWVLVMLCVVKVCVGTVAMGIEAHNWNFAKVTLAKILQGGFIFGLSLIFIGIEFVLRGGHDGAPFLAISLAGFLWCTLFAVLIVVEEKLHRHFERRTDLEHALVLRRFGLDDNYSEFEDAPCPWEDGHLAVVTVRTEAGRVLNIRASHEAYECAQRGVMGTAHVRGNRIVKFDRHAFRMDLLDSEQSIPAN